MKKCILFLIIIIAETFSYSQTLSSSLDFDTRKYGYKENSSWVIPPMYDSAQDFTSNSNVTLVQYFGKYGYINRNNEFVILPKYTSAKSFNKLNIAVVKDNSGEYAINYCGERVSPYCKSLFIDDNIIWGIENNGKYYLYDTKFNHLNKTGFDYMTQKYGFFVVQSNGKYGTIDAEGNAIIPIAYKYLEIHNFYKGWKQLDRDNVTNKIDNFLIEVADENSNWGIITILGDIVVPCKYHTYSAIERNAKKYYKKDVLPLLTTQWDNQQAAIKQTIKDVEARRKKTNISTSPFPNESAVGNGAPIELVHNQDGWCFMVAGIAMSNKYQEMNNVQKCYIVKDRYGKWGLCSLSGATLLSCKYDEVTPWYTSNGNVYYFLIRSGKNFGVAHHTGSIVTPVEYEKIYNPVNNTAVALKNGRFHLIGSTGKVLSRRGYDYIDNITRRDRITAEIFGFKTTLNTDGTEVTPITKQVFEKAYNTPDKYYQQKYDLYKLCIDLDSNNTEGYKAICYNNIGAIYENLQDYGNALANYNTAGKLGCDKGKQNAKRLRAYIASEVLEALANSFNQASNTINQNNYLNPYGSYSYSSSSSYSKNSSSYNNYDRQYSATNQQNINTLKRAYEGYCTQASKAQVYPENYTWQDIDRIKCGLRDTRKKIIQLGGTVSRHSFDTYN